MRGRRARRPDGIGVGIGIEEEPPMALQEEKLSLAGVPALLTFASSAERAAARGTVLILHGATASKEVQYRESHSLAERGYLAVAIDAAGHGDRRYPEGDERLAEQRAQQTFYDIVAQTAAELPAVIEALEARGWAQRGRLGAVGISMGGFILFGALVARCRLDAVVPIVASPRWKLIEPSPHQQRDRYFPTPLLMITGSADAVVPPEAARQLHEALQPKYAEAPERLRYLELPGEEHMFSPEGWGKAWGETCAWFDRFLVEK
jgi:uncharacterized protein